MAVNATAIWRIRFSGSNTNGGGYDPGIAGAATDYSQQNSAQATGTVGTASGTTTFTDAGGLFTSAMIGNALWIASGAGFTVGAYFITAFGSSTSVTLDRSPGTGTVANWALGGGWADPFTNVSTTGPLVPGNTVFILGSGTPNPSSYIYDYTSSGFIALAQGNATVGLITFANDPSTPGYKAPPDTTGGMPVLKCSGLTWNSAQYVAFKGIYFVLSAASFAGVTFLINGTFLGSVLDQLGFDAGFLATNGGSSSCRLVACEGFSSVGAVSTNAQYVVNGSIGSGDIHIYACNIHDAIGPGYLGGGGDAVVSSIFAKCGGNAITFSTNNPVQLTNNTIDGNTGNGVVISGQAQLASLVAYNNIISNQTGGGKFGITVGAGAATANSAIASFVDYNAYYNNTTNYNALNASPHDTALGSNPYVGQSTENYTLA